MRIYLHQRQPFFYHASNPSGIEGTVDDANDSEAYSKCGDILQILLLRVNTLNNGEKSRQASG